MPSYLHPIESRLPHVGTTIFSVMSKMAQEHGAINLAQGFPDFSADDYLFERAAHWMRAGQNQYAPMGGMPALVEEIAHLYQRRDGREYDPATEITVTVGATQALFTAVSAFVHPGDEVIVFEPVYDSYAPAIELQGGKVVRMRLQAPDFRPDWSAVAAAIGPRTRMIMINTPHNPSATLWTADDMADLARLTRGTGIIVVSDEVYEHIVFDGAEHVSCAGNAELAERTLVVSSFGKTFHVTGWKVGYAAGPNELMAEFRKVHQFNVFTIATPFQLALADCMRDGKRMAALPAFYQARRDFFRERLSASRFELLPTAGTFFQLARYSAISDAPDADFVGWLIREHGVAAVPVSAFYADRFDDGIVRFCFAKPDDTLARAAERLCRV